MPCLKPWAPPMPAQCHSSSSSLFNTNKILSKLELLTPPFSNLSIGALRYFSTADFVHFHLWGIDIFFLFSERNWSEHGCLFFYLDSALPCQDNSEYQPHQLISAPLWEWCLLRNCCYRTSKMRTKHWAKCLKRQRGARSVDPGPGSTDGGVLSPWHPPFHAETPPRLWAPYLAQRRGCAIWSKPAEQSADSVRAVRLCFEREGSAVQRVFLQLARCEQQQALKQSPWNNCPHQLPSLCWIRRVKGNNTLTFPGYTSRTLQVFDEILLNQNHLHRNECSPQHLPLFCFTWIEEVTLPCFFCISTYAFMYVWLHLCLPWKNYLFIFFLFHVATSSCSNPTRSAMLVTFGNSFSWSSQVTTQGIFFMPSAVVNSKEKTTYFDQRGINTFLGHNCECQKDGNQMLLEEFTA